MKTAREIIQKEVDGQNAMWGPGQERKDNAKGEMMQAAACQLSVASLIARGMEGDRAVKAITPAYPEGWEGFRSYGSVIANLAVTAAFIESEIARRLALGEDTTRTKRDEPYVNITPKQDFPTSIDE